MLGQGLGRTIVKVVLETYIECGICVRSEGHSGFADNIFGSAILVTECISDLITTPEISSQDSIRQLTGGRTYVNVDLLPIALVAAYGRCNDHKGVCGDEIPDASLSMAYGFGREVELES